MRSKRLINAARVAHPQSRRGYVLIAVLLLVGLGLVLSYGFLASHTNISTEVILDGAYQRAVRAAHNGLGVAVYEIRNAALAGDEWDDHWGYDGVVVSLKDYDASPSAGDNRDLVGIEVRRYDDAVVDPADGLTKSQFKYNPEYFKITSIGVAREGQNKSRASYPLEVVVRIPKLDSTFSNIVSQDDYSEDAALALITSGSAGQVPAYVAQNTYIEGSTYSYEPANIHGAVTGHTFYENPASSDGTVLAPADLGGEWVGLKDSDKLARPGLTLADFGHDDLEYHIEGVRFEAEELTSPQSAALDDLELGDISTKSNPANVLIYSDTDTLVLDAHDHSINCVGTIVAPIIRLIDSGTSNPGAVDFHLAPALSGFPALVCDVLILESDSTRTFISGPALIRKYIRSDVNFGAIFDGFILSSATTDAQTEAGQGFFHGLDFAPEPLDPVKNGYTHDWLNPDTGSRGTIYVRADADGPFTQLRLINGQQSAAPADGISPPGKPQQIRLRAGDHNIAFSDNFTKANTWPPP
jgi:hypothetical protein